MGPGIPPDSLKSLPPTSDQQKRQVPASRGDRQDIVGAATPRRPETLEAAGNRELTLLLPFDLNADLSTVVAPASAQGGGCS